MIFERNKQSNQSVNGRKVYVISKLYIFWFVLNFQFKFVLWDTWSGDIYPIFHGGYVSNWYGDGVLEEYVYWLLQNIFLVDMDLYSNDDILFTYKSNILNSPISSLSGNNSLIVKVDSKIGATIWAKNIIDNSISLDLQINRSFLLNDIAWSLLIYSGTDYNVPGIIAKIDNDGNLIDIFYVPFFFSEASYYYLHTIDFYLFSDQSLITITFCTYYPNFKRLIPYFNN